jgi:hypothetical protein
MAIASNNDVREIIIIRKSMFMHCERYESQSCLVQILWIFFKTNFLVIKIAHCYAHCLKIENVFAYYSRMDRDILDSAGQKKFSWVKNSSKTLCTVKNILKLTLLIFRFRVKIYKNEKKWNSKKPNGSFAESLNKIWWKKWFLSLIG